MATLDKSNIEDLFPMSDIQQGMLFHSIKDDSLSTYHDQNYFGLTDESFDLTLFRQALDQMVSKHAMLRTVFNLFDFDSPIQIVLKRVEPDLSYHDIRHVEQADARLDQIKEYLKADRALAFDLEEAKVLWRIKIIRQTETEYSLLWMFHHAIFDGWSTSSFVTELHNIYQTLKTDPAFQVSPLNSSYKDYVLEQLAGKKSESLRDFWSAELSDYKRYPLSETSEAEPDQELAHITEQLSTELLLQLKAQAGKLEVDFKTLCFSAFLYSLKMLTYERDLLLGFMSNNRPVCEDADKILGCFLNAIPFRVNLTAAETNTWADLVKLINAKREELANYDRLSFFEIVKLLNEDARDQNPFYDITYDLVDFHVFGDLDEYSGKEEQKLDELNFEKTNALLDFEVSSTLNNFSFFITYSKPAVTDHKASQIAALFKAILQKLAYGVEEKIEHEALFSESDKNLLLHSFDTSAETRIGDIVSRFEQITTQYPDKTAITDDTARLSYLQLNQEANQVAHALDAQGIQPEEIVVLHFPRGAYLLTSMLGVLKAGAAFVAIDTETPAERIRYILQNSKTRVVLTDEGLTDQVQTRCDQLDQAPNIIAVSQEATLHPGLAHYAKSNPGKSLSADQLAYVIYTSGTTGQPKGVMLHHAGMANHMEAVADYLQVTATDTMAQTASSNFDVCIMQFVLCLMTGGTTVVINKELQLQPAAFLKTIRAQQITLLELVPSHIDTILDSVSQQEGRFGAVRYLLSTGEVLPARLVKKWYAQEPATPLVNAYGPAETSDDVTLHIVDPQDSNPIPVGRPLKNIQVYIIDENDRLCPPGVLGEIAIAGVAVGKGYWNAPELTARSFTTAPFGESRHDTRMYKSGDMGYWGANGDLVVKGRVGNTVKIRGNRIELGEVENHLDKVPGISKSVVADREINGDTVLCAYYVAQTEVTPQDIRLYLADRLPSYMLPTYFTALQELPLSANGKVDRKQLPLPEVKKRDPLVATELDQLGETGQHILQVWQEVLGHDQIGPDDNFFDVGGHSLSLIKVNRKLNELLGTEVSTLALFQYPTIQSLTDHLTNHTTIILSEESMQESVELMDDAINFFSED